MALKLGGTAKAIADANKKREEEEKKAKESKNTWDGMKAAAASSKNLSDYSKWSSQGKKDEEKSGVNMTMAGPTNKALTSSQAATAAQANKATEKPKISYTGQKTKSAQDFINDWNAQKKQKNQYALEDFGKKNTQAQTFQAQKKQAEQLREAGRALDEDAKNPNRPAVRVAKTAQDVARDIASGKVKIGGKAEKKESYKPLTAEEAAARTLDREQREEDVRRGLVGNTKDKASALQTWMNDEENGADVWTLMNDMMGDQHVSAATKQAVMQANELLGVDGMKRAMLDNADSRAYMEQIFERDVWNPAQEREKAYNRKYGNPTETLQTAQERMRAHYNAQIDTDKQSLRTIAQTNPLFAAQQYSGMRDSYQQEIADLEAMRADMERHPEAYAQWEKDMARDRLLAAQNELASLGDIEKEWQPDYQDKSQAVEGVNDPVYKMINGEADAFQDTEAMAKWRMEQAENLGKREKELQEQLNALAPGDPRRELLQGQIDTLRSQTGLMYEESAMPTLDNLIFSEMMDEGDRLTYNYIYRTEGRNAANEYLDRTKTKWYAGYTDKELQELNDWLQESGWNMALGNLASMVTAPAEAISNLVYTMRTAKGELVDAKDPMFLLTRKSNLTRQATGQALANLPDKNFVGIDKGSPAEQWLNNTRRWILTNGYNLLSSGMDQYGTAWLMVVPGIGQALATGALAGKAGTAAIIETLDEGGFSRQASCRGMVTALCEYGTERIGMERLVDAFSKGKLNAGFAKTLTKSMLSEALEEVPGNLIDRAMDNWYGGENSQRNQEIKARMKQGMSQAQAEAAVDLEFIQQTATEALMAGLSAGISQGVGYVVGNVSAKHQANREQRQTLNDAARIEREYQDKYGAETAEAVRTLAQEETTEEGRVAALTTAANAVLAEKRGPINPEIAEIILKNDHPEGMKTDELNDWRQTFTNVLNDSQRVRRAEEIRKQRNQGRQQRAGERVEAEKAQAAELNEQETRPSQPADAGSSPRGRAETETPTPRTTPEERRAEAEELNEEETRPSQSADADSSPRGGAETDTPAPRVTPEERRAEAEALNEEESRTTAAPAVTEEAAPAAVEETAPAPRKTPAERRAEAEELNEQETVRPTAEETPAQETPAPRTTPAERRAEAEELNEQETRQEPVTQADVMEAIQEESEENDRRTVFAAPATTGAGEAVQITGIAATKNNKDGGAKVEITGADGTVRTVALKDVRFGRAWQQAAYDIATDLRDVEAARAFLAVAEQESMPLEAVKRDFARYYQYGRNQNENMLNVAGKAISDAAARAAYEAGAKSLTSENERVNIPKEVDAAVRKDLERIAKEKPWNQKGYRGVQFGTDVKRLTPGQAVQAYILDKIGKRNGTVYVLTDLNSSRDTSREGQVAGAYQGGNVALIDINAEGGILRAAGHETWHEMVEWASTQDDEGKTTEALRKVQQAVFDALEKTGWDLDVRVEEKKNEYREKLGQELTDEEARDELMADALPEIFNQDATELMHTLDNIEEPETKKTILEKLCDIVGRVMNYFKQLAGRIAGRNPEVRGALEADTQAMQNAYDTLRDMQEQMGQDEGWSERAGESGTRYAAESATTVDMTLQFALVDIEQENKNLLAENKNVKGVLKRTAEVLGNVRKGLTDALSGGKTAGLLARSLRNKTGTNVTLKNMRTNFEKVMTVLKAGGQENTQRAFDMLTDIVRDAVWKSSYQVDMEEMGYGQDVKEALSYIESALKHLDAEDWKSLKNLVGTNKVNEVRAWVKDKTGMTLGEYVKEGESTGGRGGLDSDYKEMQSALPGIFTEDVTNPEDILEVLLNKAESLKPDTVNDFLEPTARNMGHPEGGEAATQRITMELFTELMREAGDINEEQAETLIEQAQEGQKNREDWVDDTQNVQDIEEKINQDAQVLEDLMKLTKDAVTEVARENKENKDLRRKMEEHDARWRERYQGQTERMERNAQYNKLRNDVVRMTDSLEKKLDHPEKAKGFVPDAMMDAARKLVNAIRNSGGYSARTAREYSAGAETDLKAAQRTGLTPDVLREVRNAYEEMGKTDEGRACFDDDFLTDMDELIKLAEERMADEKSEPGMVGHNRRQAPKLTMKEMELLHSAVSHVNAAVNNANTLFNTQKAETLKEAGDRTFNDLRNRRTTYRDAGKKGRFAGFLDKAKYGMMKPYTMFKTVLRHMGVVNEIYDQVRDGMDKNVRLITQASDFVEDIMKRYPKMQESLNRLKQRGEGKRRAGAVEVKLQSGQTIRVTDQEAMTIYAIYKREQRNYGTDSQTNHLFANEHPEKGGIVLQDREKGTTSLPNMVTDTDIRNIIATIDKDLLPAIDEMVEFLSTTCSEWGNEVSQQLYGVNKFVESYYFPMKVLGSAVDTNMGEGQDARIKTGSQTKRLTKYANNPLEIRAFLDVFDDHVKKMADYSAFTLPVENMSRILNYRDEGGASVHTLIDTAYGEEVYSYLANFVRRVNGNSTIQEEGNKWIKRMVSPAKGAAVGANLSVFLQQMGAGVRAMGAENLDTKHALRGMTSVMPFVNMKKIVDFMQKHSAVAAEKAWGYLDTQQLGGVMDRQAKTLYSRLNDLGGYLAGKGDEYNWAQIYMGVLHQTCEKYGADIRDVMKNDEKYTELLADCEKTFKDVVEQTQVYDDMLQRAPFAMEKGLMSNLMAFMNEPITQMNMLMRPLIELNDAMRMKDGEAKQKAMAEAAKGLSRSALAIGVSAVLTAALAAIAQGMRDRDNEKEEEYIDENGNKKKRIVGRRTYWDKVKERWSSLLVDNLLSLGGIYSNIVKGVIQGEGITNDLAFGWAESGGRLLSMIPKCWTQDGGFDLKNMEKAGYYALQTVSNLSGIPFAGFYRDVKGVATTLVEEFVTAGTTEGDAWDIRLPMEQRLAAAQNSYVYNKAAKTGEAANRKVNTEIWTALMMTEYKAHGESATFSKIVAAAQKAGASAGSLMGKFKAEFPKISPLVDKAAQALNREDFTTYQKTVEELEKKYKLGTKTINAMVNTAFNALQEKPATSASTKSFAEELHADQGTTATIGETVAKDALAKALASGTEKQIKDAVAQAKKQGRTDTEIKSAVNAAYKQDFIEALAAGNKSKAGQLVKKMVASGAYTEADIASETLNWAKSGSQWGLYDSIRRGDTKQAANIYSWMCQTYGSSTMVKSIASWLETNAADNEENVRKCLKAMGYGAGSIETIIKKSNAKKNKTTQKTKKTNKTKTTKAWE